MQRNTINLPYHKQIMQMRYKIAQLNWEIQCYIQKRERAEVAQQKIKQDIDALVQLIAEDEQRQDVVLQEIFGKLNTALDEFYDRACEQKPGLTSEEFSATYDIDLFLQTIQYNLIENDKYNAISESIAHLQTALALTGQSLTEKTIEIHTLTEKIRDLEMEANYLQRMNEQLSLLQTNTIFQPPKDNGCSNYPSNPRSPGQRNQ